MKLKIIKPGVYALWCPGCGVEHMFDVHAVNRDGRVIGWDGDHVTPSVGTELEYPGCTFTLRGGVMRFDGDCLHPLAGRETLMIDYPEEKT